MIGDFKKALSGIKRIEKIVFPIMKCTADEEYLSYPDPEKIDDLKITSD